MRYRSDPELTQKLLTQWGIPALFSTPNLTFSLVEYQPGEFLTSPNQITDRFLFLVQGTVAIRSIRPDGSEYVLTGGGQLTLLGDVEFVTKQLPAFFAQASTPVLALALPIAPYAAALEEDATFLRFLLRCITEKLMQSAHTEAFGGSLEDRLLHWMDCNCPDGILTRMGETAALLHCSTRQLQRVLRHLTETGQLRRIGKGVYCRCSKKSDKNTANAP